MSDLREALEAHEADYNLKMVADHHVAVVAAARRFLALTETGPDYEAAKREFLRLFPTKTPTYDLEDRMLVGEVIKPIVDAAFADYLTEEET